MRHLHASLLDRIKHGDLPQLHMGALLVLPDVQVRSAIVAYPRERIIDAAQMDRLCATLVVSFRTGAAQLQPARNQQRLCRGLQQCHPAYQGQCPWVSQLHQLPGKDSVSLWQAELGYGLKNPSEFDEAPIYTKRNFSMLLG